MPPVDKTPVFAHRELTLGIESLKRIDNGTEELAVDGSETALDEIAWNGTGASDTGGDWTRSGVGTESVASKKNGTNGLDSGVMIIADKMEFVRATPLDPTAASTNIAFWFQIKVLPPGSQLKARFRLSNSDVGNAVDVEDYIPNTDLDVWRRVVIPLVDFGLAGGDIDEFRLVLGLVDGGHFWIDDIELSGLSHIFRLAAPDGTQQYHVSSLILIINTPTASWVGTKFADLAAALPVGLLIRHRDSAGEQDFWSVVILDNVDLYGKLISEESTFSGGDFILRAELKPFPAGIIVTDSNTLDVVVRDDLSSISKIRAYAQYGVESTA